MGDIQDITDMGLESNKRDHKVGITDIAISKVPYIEYKEIDSEHYEIIQLLAKRVLTLSRDKNDGKETAITYSMDMLEDFLPEDESCVGVSYGDEHYVKPFDDPIAYELVDRASGSVIVVIHNHPSLSKVSLQDVWLFLKYAAIKMIVVVTNLGAINYIVKESTYNRFEAIKLYNDAVDMERAGTTLKEKQDAANFFLKNCSKVGIIFDDR